MLYTSTDETYRITQKMTNFSYTKASLYKQLLPPHLPSFSYPPQTYITPWNEQPRYTEVRMLGSIETADWSCNCYQKLKHCLWYQVNIHRNSSWATEIAFILFPCPLWCQATFTSKIKKCGHLEDSISHLSIQMERAHAYFALCGMPALLFS